MSRTLALLSKDLRELRAHPGIFLPALLTGLVALALPFVVAIVIPATTGERLADSSDFTGVVAAYQSQSSAGELDAEGAVQAWIFHQFLLLLVLSPIAASMSVAASSVVGEKQARTLEPLLATPVTTFELLAAKTLSALLPAVALTTALFGIYLAAILIVARPGVAGALLAPQPMLIMFLLGPLAALAALQLAVCMSSRTNDARSAQQMGALIILPMAALLVMQLLGAVELTTGGLLLIAAGLVVINVVLARIGIILFDREAILIKWT